jgi:hypothetical protein
MRRGREGETGRVGRAGKSRASYLTSQTRLTCKAYLTYHRQL